MFALLTAMSKAGELQRIASPKQAGSPAVERARLLQHSIGNQATIQLLTQGASITTGDAGSHDSPDSEPKKTRIEIGPVDDQQEREAHRVAEQVLRMPAGEMARSSAPLEIGRKCSDCEEAEPEARARRTSVPVIVEDVLRSSGRPLDAATRSIFEQRFGRDFGAVRVHADAVAAQSAAAVDARAYTVGRHIVLGRETDGSQSGIGGRLLAHELTHTIQQAS